MKVAPFPLPLNIGADIVYLPRILRLIRTQAYLGRFTRRILHDRELNDFYTRFPAVNLRALGLDTQPAHKKPGFVVDAPAQPPSPSPTPSPSHQHSNWRTRPPSSPEDRDRDRSRGRDQTIEIARWLAGRFAAKEAARKAAPGGASSISWKEVMVRTGSKEPGKGRPDVVYLMDGGKAGRAGRLSISHDGDYVIATVLAPDMDVDG